MKRALTALLFACAISACASEAPPPSAHAPAGNVAEGQRLAEINCSTCHAIGREGESRHPMAPPFRTFSQNYPVEQLSEAFAEGILVGHRDMPEFRLEPQQIDDLLAYIQSIQDSRAG